MNLQISASTSLRKSPAGYGGWQRSSGKYSERRGWLGQGRHFQVRKTKRQKGLDQGHIGENRVGLESTPS